MRQSTTSPIAGPSTSTPSSSKRAPEHPLPPLSYYSIEYPGYVKQSSIPLAISNLGGQDSLDASFKRSASKNESLVELKLRPENPFAHPIPGYIVPTSNILLKVVKRKRKTDQRHEISETDGPAVGEYTAEAVGIIPKTVRFRTMADYQFQPDVDDPIVKLRMAMQSMDPEPILEYRIPDEKEDYRVPFTPLAEQHEDTMDVVIDPQLIVSSVNLTEDAMQVDNTDIDPQLLDPAVVPLVGNVSQEGKERQIELEGEEQEMRMRSNLRLIPPPIFTRQFIAQNYNFKANPASIVTTTINEETGEEKKRLINRMRWKGYGPATIMFVDTEVPTGPPVVSGQTRKDFHQGLLKRLEELFTERPIWTRASLLNQFTVPESREILNSKTLLPLVSYVFSDGPWRDTLVTFGYDPRKLPEARFYQKLYFRNVNHPIARASLLSRRQERNAETTQLRSENLENDEERKNSHIFDGKYLTKETASFQLCDITDPLLKSMINDPSEVREDCDERDGWYTASAMDRIKTVMRHKFFSLLEGYVATDEECLAIRDFKDGEKAKVMPMVRPLRLRTGKHNMAKGAQRPEDIAVLRLRAALQNSGKSGSI